MQTHTILAESAGNLIPDTPLNFYLVVSADAFIGEDAAEAVRAFDPRAEIRVVQTLNDATLIATQADHVTGVMVIAPNEPLGPTPLVAALLQKNAALMVIANSVTSLGPVPGRFMAAELPFTNETILGLLKQVHIDKR